MTMLRVMVSSSVHGNETLIEQACGILKTFGYEVWSSHIGTLPTDSSKTNFDNCLAAVDDCDVFLAFITGRYGSGALPGELGITHREIRRAIEIDKQRWLTVHRDVVVARQLLKQFRFKDGKPVPDFQFKPTAIIDDVRVIDMYEDAMRQNEEYPKRTGNWVQEYRSNAEALDYVTAQLKDYARVAKLVAAKNVQP